METNKRIDIFDLFLFPNTKTRIIISTLILVLIPLISFFVYETGGIKYVFSHSMYLPIILAGIFWGMKVGLLVAIAGGLLLGPLMPIDVILGEEQLLINWLYRLLFFIIISLIVGWFRDALRKNLQKLKYVSSHNEDTGLLNMVSLKVDNEIIDKLNNPKKDILVVSLLWNNYHEIINMFGIEITIEIVKEIDNRFLKYFHENYKLLQSEMSSLYAIIENDDVDFCLQQIQYALDKPFTIQSIPFYVEFSIGITGYDRLGTEDFDSFQKANIASLYSRKIGLPSSVFDENKILINKNNLLLLGEFPKAIKDRHIVLYYQPKIDLRTKKPVGMEALIRWLHPDKGLIAPMDFIPLVEKSNLIHIVTEFVLHQSFMKMNKFMDLNFYLSMSVNISPKNLLNPRFLEQVMDIFDKYSIPSNSVEFEITESALMHNPEKVNNILNSLKDYNVQLSIDDFGTGYSSLAYLSRFPIDAIKIDQFFVKQLFTLDGMKHIIKAAIDLSHNLGLKVIAEGIEDEKTELELINMGCDMGQGYLYSRPLSDSEILPWFQRHA